MLNSVLLTISDRRFVARHFSLKMDTSLKSFVFNDLGKTHCSPFCNARHSLLLLNFNDLQEISDPTSKDVYARFVAGNT